MTRLLPFCRVTVFALHQGVETRLGCSIHYRHIQSFRMPPRGRYRQRELMAAMAWVKCEGIKRREKLTDMGAPDEIVRSQTDVQAIAREMRLGPPDLFDEVYIYDNMVQSWLIEISDRDADVRSPTRSQMRAILKTRHSKRSGDGEAFPWSMWFPDAN